MQTLTAFSFSSSKSMNLLNSATETFLFPYFKVKQNYVELFRGSDFLHDSIK